MTAPGPNPSPSDFDATSPVAPPDSTPRESYPPSAVPPSLGSAVTRQLSTHFSPHGSFEPGQTLAGRYRIVSRLGKGGMGEVYRADDLTLGVTVALKFLPAGLSGDQRWLENFRSEVRLARQIAHTNVCRVYDINESNGLVFLTMEYVDGEDLASLLRRIGRLPEDKAVQLSRQICLGLAAAHELGVIHRDLKPANIMIDGRGNARIMDFGIAGVTEQLAQAHIAAGTPAYMAPEQFSGTGVTPRSDLYSLGLVLYELFTGKSAFNVNTLDEVRRVHETGSHPALPSTLVRDFNPAVEGVILRCLERDPEQRPASAIVIAAALPGGDPLAAALAAGETPSPELVAQSGGEGTLKPAVIVACVAVFLLLTVAVTVVRGRFSILHYANLDLSAEVLASKSRDVVKSFGYTDKPLDTAYGFTVRKVLLSAVAQNDPSPDRWEKLAAGEQTLLSFWYRENPQPLRPSKWWMPAATSVEPPDITPGATNLVTDTRGRLRSFSRISPTFPAPGHEAPRTVDLTPLFSAAGVQSDQFKPTTPQLTPSVASDTRLAWQGDLPGTPPLPVTLEAATERAQLTSFTTVYPWSQRAQAAPEAAPATSVSNQILMFVSLVAELAIFALGAILAWRNVHAGRADRRGAARIAFFVFALRMTISLLSGSWAGDNLSNFFGTPMVRATYFATLWWVFYLALEPTLRRVWPHTLISWSRLLDGRFRDPLVGRDALIGAMAGVLIAAAEPLPSLVARLTGQPPPIPLSPNLQGLSGTRFMFAQGFEWLDNAIASTLLLALGLVILRLVFRNSLLAAIGLGTAIALIIMQDSDMTGASRYYAPPLVAILMTFILTRLGVFAFAAALFVGSTLRRLPLTTDFSAWYAAPAALVVVVAVILPVLAAARIALGNQRLLKGSLLEP